MMDVGRRRYRKMKFRLKRRTRSRRGGRRRMRRVTMQWPRFRLVKFKVVSQFTGSSTGGTGAIAQYVIQANHLSDPHTAMGGNLPLGLDQWAAMYSKYVVVKSTHYAKVHNVTSTGAISFGLTLRSPGEQSLLANAEAFLEQPITRSKILSPDVDHAALGITYSAKKYWHVRKFMDHDDLHATFGTSPGSPSKLCYVSFWFEDVNRANDFTVEGYFTSEYTCLLFEPVQPSRSTL